jgi:hypothetical protein
LWLHRCRASGRSGWTCGTGARSTAPCRSTARADSAASSSDGRQPSSGTCPGQSCHLMLLFLCTTKCLSDYTGQYVYNQVYMSGSTARRPPQPLPWVGGNPPPGRARVSPPPCCCLYAPPSVWMNILVNMCTTKFICRGRPRGGLRSLCLGWEATLLRDVPG